eukprot:5670524-Lingulodinium_polyedra.AAC.1
MASIGRVHHLSVSAFPFVSGEALESSIGARTCGQRCHSRPCRSPLASSQGVALGPSRTVRP